MNRDKQNKQKETDKEQMIINHDCSQEEFPSPYTMKEEVFDALLKMKQELKELNLEKNGSKDELDITIRHYKILHVYLNGEPALDDDAEFMRFMNDDVARRRRLSNYELESRSFVCYDSNAAASPLQQALNAIRLYRKKSTKDDLGITLRGYVIPSLHATTAKCMALGTKKNQETNQSVSDSKDMKIESKQSNPTSVRPSISDGVSIKNNVAPKA